MSLFLAVLAVHLSALGSTFLSCSSERPRALGPVLVLGIRVLDLRGSGAGVGVVEVPEGLSPGAWALSQAQAWGPRFRELKPPQAGSSHQVLARVTDTPPGGPCRSL